MEDLTGKQLGPYRIEGPLGEGGMAAVYKAHQASMDRHVALKILPRHFASDPAFIARFDQEARIIARLQHVHILPVYDYGHTEGFTYIVMPFISTGTLADVMRSGGLSLERIRTIISQVGEALGYAHSQGVIHRDIKPSNILVDDQGNCRLTDFGIAKMVEGTLHLTQTGAITGTPAYMSPEQIQGQTLDGRSDLYSLGVILFEMVTGRPPFLAETPAAVLVKHLHDRPPSPRSIRRDLPPALEKVIVKSLAKAREERYPDLAAFVRAVKAAIPETPATRPDFAPPMPLGTAKVSGARSPLQAPPTVVRRAARPGRRQLFLAAGAVAALVIAGAIATMVVPAISGRPVRMGQTPSPEQALAASPTFEGVSSAASPFSIDAPGLSPTLEPSATPAPSQISLTKDQVRRLGMSQRLLNVRAWAYQEPDNLYVHFTGTADRNLVNRYDPATLEITQSVVVGVDAVDMDLSPDGSRLMLMTSSAELRLWRLDEGREEWTSEPLYGVVWTAGVALRDQLWYKSSSWSPDGQRFFLAGPAGVGVWEADAADPVWTDRFPGNQATRAAWSPDSRQVAINWGSRTVLSDAETGARTAILPGSTGTNVVAFAWHPDGSTLAVGRGTIEHTWVELWHAKDLFLFSFPVVHTGWISGLAWSPDGEFVASASGDGTILTWDPGHSAQVAGRFAPLAGPMQSVAWSPDGIYLAGGTVSGAILIWDAAIGDIVNRLSERSAGTEGSISPRVVERLLWLPNGGGLISFVRGPGAAYFLSLWTEPKP